MVAKMFEAILGDNAYEPPRVLIKMFEDIACFWDRKAPKGMLPHCNILRFPIFGMWVEFIQLGIQGK